MNFAELWLSYGILSKELKDSNRENYIPEIKIRLVNSIYIGSIPYNEESNKDILSTSKALDKIFTLIITV